MYILGVSGSPTKNANTDKLVKEVIDSTGLETAFVKLSDYNIGPCRACMSCVKTNKCVIKDDFQKISPTVMKADALVVGSPTYYGLPSAFTKAFMERLYAFRHVNLLTKGKVGAAIQTSRIFASSRKLSSSLKSLPNPELHRHVPFLHFLSTIL